MQPRARLSHKVRWDIDYPKTRILSWLEIHFYNCFTAPSYLSNPVGLSCTDLILSGGSMFKIATLSKLLIAMILLEACAWTTPRSDLGAAASPPATNPGVNGVPITPSSPLGPDPSAPVNPSNPPSSDLLLARSKIRHVVVIMQENRSFDHYFGTFPGADGIPMQNGIPTVCVNDPKTNQCIKPFHDPNDINRGGPHGSANATEDIAGGKMDGIIPY